MTKKARILLMDDDEILRRLAANKLNRLGYETVTAPEGETAVNLYESAMQAGEPFDVVILDLVVEEGLSGEETMARLLSIDPAVKAVATSGFINEPTMTDYWDLGFKDVLAKPYLTTDLDSLLQAVITGDDSSRDG